MNDSGLQTRIFDFLKNHPPFNLIDSHVLIKLSSKVHVKYYEKDEFLYRAGEKPGEFAFVIRQGGVEKILNDNGNEKIVDIVDEGDICGVASLITGKEYRTSTRVIKDTMVYAIPWKYLFPLFEIYPKVSLFFASGYAKNMPYIRFNLNEVQVDSGKLSLSDSKYSIFREDDIFPINPEHELVFCSPDTKIIDAADIITRQRTGSVLVADSDMKPLGIVTDVDFRKKVIAGRINPEDSVEKIMSSPVITILPGMTSGSLILQMVRNNIRHLCITRDGTANSEALGVISEHDILLLHGNNPAILVREIMAIRDKSQFKSVRKRTDNLLGQYLIQETSITFVTNIISGINDAIIHKSIGLAKEKLEAEGINEPDVNFCWLEIGSQGRSEQLIATDQDNALVYDDPPAGTEEETKKYFLRFAEEVNENLAEYGFQFCPSNMMARNPKWCQPVSQWKKYFSDWIRVPEERALMHATIFFDFRPVYGHSKLASILREHISSEMDHERAFVNFLARNALLNPPPLSFLSNLIVEKSGEHKNKFDIKLRGTMPLSDAARVLALDYRIDTTTNTIERFRKIAEKNPNILDLCTFAISSYELFTKFRTLNGLETGDSGRYLDPSILKKIEKNALKNAFRTIEKIQEHLTSRYRLDFMRS